MLNPVDGRTGTVFLHPLAPLAPTALLQDECQGCRWKSPPGDRSGPQASVGCRGTSFLGGDGGCSVGVSPARRPERGGFGWRRRGYVLFGPTDEEYVVLVILSSFRLVLGRVSVSSV